MTGRFRATSSRWDWPKGGASPDSPMAQKSVCKISVSKAKNPSAAKRGKYKEPEKGFFFVSEDGHQVLICGKGVETDDIQAMSNVISHASVVNLSYNAIATIPAGLPGSMTALDLSKNQLSGLYGLENVSNLRELYLGGNSIESTWGLTVATSLEILDLSSNNIKLIEGLETLIYLKRLNLKFNNIKGMAAVRSLSFNKGLLVLDLSDNPVSEKKDYKRNILHLVPSLEVLDDLKIGFDIFRKNNDYTTRYLNMKQFNENHDRNGSGFLWSGRSGRWDGVVFQAANTSNVLTGRELRALSDGGMGSDISDLYGTKSDAKKYPWRREPDIVPRPLQFNSAAQENDYRAKTPTKTFSPASSKRRSGSVKSPASYMEMTHDESYVNTVLSQHMERPEWHKYYKPVSIGTQSITAKLDADNERKKNKLITYPSEIVRGSTVWTDANIDKSVFMGCPSSLNGAYYSNHGSGDDNCGSPHQSLDSENKNIFHVDSDREDGVGDHEHADTDLAVASINSKELESTLMELVEHKRALLRRLQNARAARA